jgi:hypothetical protein
MKRKPLHVSLHAREPSVVELTVGDRVQLDRLTRTPHGNVAERHGRLLGPGVATVALDPGCYFFKTLSDANLRVVTGGVTAGVATSTKDPPPPPPVSSPDDDGTPPATRGDEAPGESPGLTIEYA